MPELTPKLGIKKPLGNETVSRAAFNENWDIIDAGVVADKGGVPSIQAGADASKPSPGTAGRLYVATDTQIIYRDTGSAWAKVGVVRWGDIDGKPSSFPPSAHTHAGSDITSVVANATNADTVDGAHAGTGANNVLKLDSAGLVPLGNIPNTLPGKSADLLDGYHANTGTNANTIPVRDNSGNIPGNITGNAATATKLATARTISLTGDVTGSASFDGSANASISAILANSGVTAGTYRQVTVDAKGRVTAGSNPTTLSGYGITDAVRNAGSTPSIQAGADASKPSPGTAGRLYIATDTGKIYRDTGSSWQIIATINWNDITGKPSTFTPSAHKSTHASGGSDALSPADIGAETPAGAQAKAAAAEANAKNYADETKVSKAGDTITGILTMSGSNAINFGGKFTIAYNSVTNSLDITVVG